MGFAIENKVAVVTGANRGIGKAIVDSLISQGAEKVYLAVRNPESTKALEEKYGDKVVTIQADLSDAESVKRLAEQAVDAEIVVNNGGVLIQSSPLSANIEEIFQKELDVNVFGLLRVANAFAGILVKNQGALVQMNSVASLRNFNHVASYSASKAAAYTFTQGLREDLGKKGVAILSVHPGPVATDMGTEAGFEGGASPSQVAEGIVEALAAGNFHLFPDEMAKQFETAYQSFSETIVMADFSE